MDVKTLKSVQLKDADAGEVTAVFATLDVVDHDGDVILPGAFTDGAPVRISAYGHRSWDGTLPVGKGVIREVNGEAVFEGRFFMDTTHGRDTFLTVKEMDDLQEWSFSLDEVVAERGEKNGRQVRFIKSVTVDEVSPVLKGAGIGTRSLAVKGRKQTSTDLHRALRTAGRERWGGEDTYVYVADVELDESWAVFDVWADEDADDRLVRVDFERNADGTVTLGSDETDVERTTNYRPKAGQRFGDQLAAVVTAVKQATDRATDVVTLRAEQGKGLPAERVEQIEELVSSCKQLEQLITDGPSNDDPPTPDATQEYLRFVAQTHLQEA